MGSPVVLVLLLLSQEVYGPNVLNLHKWLLVPPISLQVLIWCLIQKHVSFNLVAAILATDWLVSLSIDLQIFTTASLSSSDKVKASLSICTLCSVVVALAVKPNSWLYHVMKFSRVSLSLAICQVLFLAIKEWYYMAVAGLINCRGGHQVVIVPLPLVVRSQMGLINWGTLAMAMGQGATVMWLKTIGRGRWGHSCNLNPYSGHD